MKTVLHNLENISYCLSTDRLIKRADSKGNSLEPKNSMSN